MTIKYVPLFLGLSVGIATQAMEPASGYKEKKANLKEAIDRALEQENFELFLSLRIQAQNEKFNHSLQKSHATATDIKFAKAVEAQDAAAVKELISQGANVNIKWLGKPALIHALSHETVNITLIESLLSSSHIDANSTDKEGNTALRIIQNRRSHFEATSLEQSSLLEAAKLLITRNDCNVNITPKTGKSVISKAIHDLQDHGIINLILERAEKDTQKNSAAVKNEAATFNTKHKESIDTLLANKADTYFALLPADIFRILKQANFIPKPSQPIDLTDSLRFLTTDPNGIFYGGTTFTKDAAFRHMNSGFREKYKERIEKIREEQKKV